MVDINIEKIQKSASNARASYGGTLALSVGMTAAAHPLTFVKVMIQFGYEPIPATETTTWFGKKVLRLPNFFQYVKYISEVDGWLGIYRGLGPRIAHNIINTTVTNVISQKLKEENEEGLNSTDVKSVQAFLKETGNLALARTVGSMFSYPFHVISVRMMVQFIGKETYYTNIYTSIKEIYQEGVMGFFSGFVPNLIGELFALWMLRTLNYLAMNYLVSQELSQLEEVRSYSQGISNYISSFVAYPFQLVTNIMAVNNSNLAAGNPPFMAIYPSWTDCWIELGKKGLRNRGSSLFRRNLTS